MGLDTGSNRWHAVTSENVTIQSGPLKGKAWENPDGRRQKLYSDAEAFFALLPAGSHIFCEEPLALKNGKTTRVLCLAAGAIWTAHLCFDLFWYWVDVASWKKQVVGNGNSDKAMIAQFVREQGHEYPEEDLFDAHCVRMYGEQQLSEQGMRILK